MPSKSIYGVANVSLLESLQNFSNFNVHVTYLGILLRCRLCFGKLQVGQTYYISNKCLELQEALAHEPKFGRSYKIYFKVRVMQSWWEILVRWLCPKSILLLRSLGTLNAHDDWFSSVCFPLLFSPSNANNLWAEIHQSSTNSVASTSKYLYHSLLMFYVLFCVTLSLFCWTAPRTS